jgi:hypothetical protein
VASYAVGQFGEQAREGWSDVPCVHQVTNGEYSSWSHAVQQTFATAGGPAIMAAAAETQTFGGPGSSRKQHPRCRAKE